MEPTVDGGFITWIDVTIHAKDESVEVGRVETEIGHVRIALVHAGEALNRAEPLGDILDADSQEMCDIYDVFFDGVTPRSPYDNGNGMDLLYVADLELATDWQGRMIEEAVVQRLVETWGGGCAVAVMSVADLVQAQRWEQAGFTMMALAPRAHHCGYVASDLSMKQPRVVEADEQGHRFRIAPIAED